MQRKGGKIEQIPLNYKACQALASYLKVRPRVEHSGLFITKFKTRMTSRSIEYMVAKYLRESGIMERDALSGKQAERVGYISMAGHHLLQLINEVLDMARIEAGYMELMLVPIALEEVVPAACALVMPLATDRGIRLDLDVAPVGRCQVLADRQRLTQVLLNLLTNAIKYTHAGGHVSVVGSLQPGARLRIAVQDTGSGIAAVDLPKLFTPFERLTAASSMVEGTGLGLAVAQGLMAAQHGTLEVQSVVGAGSTFWIELPQAAAADERLDDLMRDRGAWDRQDPDEATLTFP